MSSRILSHLAATNRSNPYRSAYKKHYSAETAPLRVHNDELMAVDQGKSYGSHVAGFVSSF